MAGRKIAGNLLQDADRQENEDNIRKAYAEEASYGQQDVLPTTPETQSLIDIGNERAATDNTTIGSSDVKVYDTPEDTSFDSDIDSVFGNIDQDIEQQNIDETNDFLNQGNNQEEFSWDGLAADPQVAKDKLREQTRANFGRELSDAEVDNIIETDITRRRIPGATGIIDAVNYDENTADLANTILGDTTTPTISSFNDIVSDTILGKKKLFPNSLPEPSLGGSDALFGDALRAIGVDPTLEDSRTQANEEAVKLYTVGLLESMQNRLSTIEQKKNEIESQMASGAISKNQAAFDLKDYSENQGQINIASLSDDAIRLVQTWKAADIAAASANPNFDASQLPQVDPRSSRALGAAVLESLSRNKGDAKDNTWVSEERGTDDTLSNSFEINDPIREVLGQLKTLARTTAQTKSGYRTSVISPGGLGLGDATSTAGTQLGKGVAQAGQKVVADVVREAKGRADNPLALSLDYWGTRQLKTMGTTLNTNIAMLRSVVNNMVKPSGIAQEAIFDNMIVSNSPFAAQFAVSYQSVVTSMNSSKMKHKGIPHMDIYREGYTSVNMPMNQRLRAELNAAVAGMRAAKTTGKFKKPLYRDEDIKPLVLQWFNESVLAHNNRASDHVNAIMAATSENGKVFTYEFDTMGMNMRTQIRNSIMSIQSNPILRGVLGQAKPVLIQDPTANNKLTRKFKMAAVFNLGLVHPLRAQQILDQEISKKYKPEFESSQEILRETYDLHFGDAKKARVIFDKYNKTINADEAFMKIREKGAELLGAANAMRGFKIENGKTVTVNKTDNVRNTVPNNKFAQTIVDGALQTGGLSTSWRQPVVQDALNKFQGAGFNPDQEQAIADALGFTDSNGNPHAREKEGSLAINTLLNIADFQRGLPFDASLQYEKDGANNGFALIGMMTLDSASPDTNALLQHSGVINTGLSRLSNLPLLPMGDMREFFNNESIRVAPDVERRSLEDPSLSAEKRAALTEAWPGAHKALASIRNTGSWKEAWKQVIMQAGYGKELKSFGELIKGTLDLDPGLRAKLDNDLDGITADQAMQDLALTSRYLLEEVLSPVADYTKTLKDIAAHVSHANQSVVFENYAGRELGLAKNQFRTKPVKFQDVEQQGTKKIFLPTSTDVRLRDPLERINFPIPGTSKTVSLYSSATSLAPEEQKSYFSGNEYKTKLAQVSGLPPLLVHSKDASIMTETGADYHGKDITFLPIFDAIYSSFENFGEIEKTYNTNLIRVMRESNHYLDGYKLIERTEKANLKELSPRAAMFYLNDAMEMLIFPGDDPRKPNQGRKEVHDSVFTPRQEEDALNIYLEMLDNPNNLPDIDKSQYASNPSASFKSSKRWWNKIHGAAKRLKALEALRAERFQAYIDEYSSVHGKATLGTRSVEEQAKLYAQLASIDKKFDADMNSPRYLVKPADMKYLIDLHNLVDPIKEDLKAKAKVLDKATKKFTDKTLLETAQDLGLEGVSAENPGVATFNMPWAFRDDDR